MNDKITDINEFRGGRDSGMETVHDIYLRAAAKEKLQLEALYSNGYLGVFVGLDDNGEDVVLVAEVGAGGKIMNTSTMDKSMVRTAIDELLLVEAYRGDGE
tara:strand:- start:648 stop:950 length:303 start_codon:yes stop_codon:yes gene_type:complete